MAVRRTMTMNWDGLGDLDDDEEIFFDSVVPLEVASSSSDDEFDDSRMSFSSAADYGELAEFQTGEYDMWMAAPESITDRRRRLLEDMGLNSNKDLLSGSSIAKGAPSRPKQSRKSEDLSEKELPTVLVKPKEGQQYQACEPFEGLRGILMRSMSDGGIDTSFLDTNRRKEEMIGSILKQRLTRTSSGFSTNHNRQTEILIKNSDNGKEFEVKGCNNERNWNKLRDAQTGQHIPMEEFEKNAGHSPKVKELTKNEDDDSKNVPGDRKLTPANSSFKKSFRKSKKKGAALFKNMKLGSMGGSKSQKEKDPKITNSPSIKENNPPLVSESKSPSQWVKVRVHGKPYKEFTALHLSQEIKGHEGSIWAMKFTYDGHYLATAGEDKVIRVWEVQECDVMSMRSGDDSSSAGGTPVHPMAMASPDGRPPLPDALPEKKKKGKKKKGIPDYVHVPETVFGLSETPFCILEGHLEDVLDLSWSRSQLLLSSSMDKTVRLWDIETKNCLKTFSHTEYVTCIQFNPANDDYFISGSLDSKVRIWNIPERQVVDWIDLHEMVTSVAYSTDGKVSVAGSHKGICRFYNTTDCKLEFKEQIELKTKKKPQPKKITGFQFSAWNPSELLVTSADSRVRILDGTKVIQKFKGYKNINSQYSADFSPDGKYVISASEDSQVYIWRHEETRSKSKRSIVKSYENFPCKEVSVTAPWPGSSKLAPPTVTMNSKKHSKKSTTTLPPSAADETGQSKRSSSLPPVPKRSGSSLESNEDAHGDSNIEPCESFSSATGSSGRLDETTAPSPANSKSKTIQATAWGFVIVTGGMSGELKVFQNVGLPFKVGRL
ncbi:hypothetical protein L2E82_12674 [Cichorium intybus]|uniref:Uncharacterized protein n=1 Tax=Cichorium intybus TaxID=13427 RepID=A0ACB9GHZ0_CICIN|nr:hypothetical protein L2E82_12674 [Cichorium intybus]